MQLILRKIDPKLSRPVERYRDAFDPLSAAIAEEYSRLSDGDVLDNKVRGLVRVRLGVGTRIKGARAIDSLARTTIARRAAWRGHVLTQVEIESGMIILANSKRQWEKELQRLYDFPNEVRVSPIVDHAWIVFGRYIDLLKHHPDFKRVRTQKVRPETAPEILALCEKLPMPLGARQTLIGDVALLQFDACAESALFPGFKTLSALYAELERRGYARLAATKPQKDERQRLELIIKDMARGLDQVTVIEVDFTTVFESYHFEHQPKKRSD